jgi:hypothetical protein
MSAPVMSTPVMFARGTTDPMIKRHIRVALGDITANPATDPGDRPDTTIGVGTTDRRVRMTDHPDRRAATVPRARTIGRRARHMETARRGRDRHIPGTAIRTVPLIRTAIAFRTDARRTAATVTRIAGRPTIARRQGQDPSRSPRPTRSNRTRSSSPVAGRSRRRSSPGAPLGACSSYRTAVRPSRRSSSTRRTCASRSSRSRVAHSPHSPGSTAIRASHSSSSRVSSPPWMTSWPARTSATSRRSSSSSTRSRIPTTSAPSCAAPRAPVSTA